MRGLIGLISVDRETIVMPIIFCPNLSISMRSLRNSRTGRVMLAVRENERAVQSYGVNLIRAKLTAFAFSGFIAALAGAVFSLIGCYYYLKVVKVMFFEEPEGEGPRIHPDRHLRLLFAVNAVALLVLGLFADTILHWCGLAFPV